jgi:hypothetical protein
VEVPRVCKEFRIEVSSQVWVELSMEVSGCGCYTWWSCHLWGWVNEIHPRRSTHIQPILPKCSLSTWNA